MNSPFKRVSPTVMSPSVAPPPGLWNARPFEGVTPPIAVLIVDDDSAGAEALAAALATEGFRTIVAVGGNAAFRTEPAWTPHVVTLDIEMPDRDGFAVASAMRSSNRFANVPIIAYTSLNEAEVIERGREAQIDAFCRKGHSVRSLLALIEHVAPSTVPGRGRAL
ncbi:response regulator receiver protein [Caballeronia temeraria]|uniref:Response regulator receiver protein n=1 Tax=Caballeronia temeraria TaxID=1777137 RepID=A0A158AGK5_9BURK|nr:response regulator [Caballeronia temeraria]SAK56849.1 response regulator receiver protein [Caballeronia temeraria]